MKKPNNPFDMYLPTVIRLEEEFYDDFFEVTTGISKEMENRLMGLDSDCLRLNIITEVIIRLCVQEICRWSSFISEEGREKMWKKINEDQKKLTKHFFKELCKYLESDENSH
jgi:hypothetical protein